MNKKICNQIEFFASGLISRLNDNENLQLFTKIVVEYKSGLKPFVGRAVLRDDSFCYTYNGNVYNNISANELFGIIIKECEKYHEVVVTYSQRGCDIKIIADEKGVKVKQEDNIKTAIDDVESDNTSQMNNREYFIKIGEANALLREVGIISHDGKIKNDKIRKYNQIDYFVGIISKMVEVLPKDKTIVIMDCASGKSFLSFLINFYFVEKLKLKCKFVCIDYNANVIEKGRTMAKNLGYNNMEFIEADLREFKPTQRPDFVISLHACDIATDMAIALGVKSSSCAILAVPCCHKEMLSQYDFKLLKPITKHGVLNARIAAAITDGVRGLLLESYGYECTISEYISPLETPKNLMIQAVKNIKINKNKAKEEYMVLKETLSISPSLERFVDNNTKH